MRYAQDATQRSHYTCRDSIARLTLAELRSVGTVAVDPVKLSAHIGQELVAAAASRPTTQSPSSSARGARNRTRDLCQASGTCSTPGEDLAELKAPAMSTRSATSPRKSREFPHRSHVAMSRCTGPHGSGFRRRGSGHTTGVAGRPHANKSQDWTVSKAAGGPGYRQDAAIAGPSGVTLTACIPTISGAFAVSTFPTLHPPRTAAATHFW